MTLFLALFALFFSQETQIQKKLISEATNSRFYTSSYRFYDSKVGRFLSADPVVPEAQSSKGLSRYAYVYNNPIEFDDPDGHVPNDRSREVRDYDEALIDYNNQVLADLGYAGFTQENEEDRGTWSRMGPAAAFGTREALRFGLATITDEGQTAKIMLGIDLSNPDEASYFMRLTDLAVTKVKDHNVVSTLNESRLGSRTFEVLNNPDYFSTEKIFKHTLKAGAEGVRLGLSQTPVLGHETAVSRVVELGNNLGFKVPMVLNVFGGGAGMLNSAQYENDFFKILGMTGGGLELVAGVMMAIESKVIRAVATAQNLAARHTSAFRLLRARSLSVIGGGMSLTAWGLYELNKYIPQKPLTPDWENMSPEERIETENKFIDPGF